MQDLERILDEYLIRDLLALSDTRVGFPTLMTVFAGVELLGSLLSNAEYGTESRHLVHYRTEYLYPSSARPQIVNEASVIYEFVRHSVMHHFFPKGSIGVTGSDPTTISHCSLTGCWLSM